MSDFNTNGRDAGDMDSEQIRDLAYQLWEQDGRPDGQPDEYWYRAQRLLSAGAPSDDGMRHAGDEPEHHRPSFIETTPAG